VICGLAHVLANCVIITFLACYLSLSQWTCQVQAGAKALDAGRRTQVARFCRWRQYHSLLHVGVSCTYPSPLSSARSSPSRPAPSCHPQVIPAGPQRLLPPLWLSSSATSQLDLLTLDPVPQTSESLSQPGLQPHSRASPASSPPFVLIPLTSNSSGRRCFPTLSALPASWSSISSRQDISRGRRSRVLLHLFRPLWLVRNTPPLHKPFPAHFLFLLLSLLCKHETSSTHSKPFRRHLKAFDSNLHRPSLPLEASCVSAYFSNSVLWSRHR
jgi:hypothetical protein